MKSYLLLKFNKVLLVLLTILGFACNSEDVPNVEYGMPNADFKVNGTIVDEISQEKLSNIQVIIKDAMSSAIDGDTVYSDANGNYQVTINTLPTVSAFVLRFQDVDGAENGAYLDTDSIVDFSDEEFVNGDGSWYSGEKSKEINIKLSPDKNK